MTRRFFWASAALLVLGGAGLAYIGRRRTPRPSPPTAAELKGLREERDALRDRFRELTARDGSLDFQKVPAGNVVIGVPTSLTESLVSQVLTGLMREVRLTLKHIKARHEDEVKANFLFGNRTIGRFILDVDLSEIQAVLKPGAPQLRLGGDKIRVKLPVTVAQGTGTGTVRFQWSGQGLAGVVCGDLDVTRTLKSNVVPTTINLEGAFMLAVEGDALTAKPKFGDVTIDLQLDPTEATWQIVDDTLAKVRDDKSGICGSAIQKVDIPQRIRAVVARGLRIRLPPRLFRPIRLLASVQQSVEIQGKTVSLSATPTGLTVTPRMIWYGADLGAQSAPTPSKVAPDVQVDDKIRTLAPTRPGRSLRSHLLDLTPREFAERGLRIDFE
jgi:hypothetical protein